jgi:hypothetical protein
MDYHGLAQRLNPPTGWTAPTELTYDGIRASALTRDHRRHSRAIWICRCTAGGS